MKKRTYSLPQTEVMMLQGLNLMDTETTSIPLPPDVGAGAPKKRTQVF